MDEELVNLLEGGRIIKYLTDHYVIPEEQRRSPQEQRWKTVRHEQTRYAKGNAEKKLKIKSTS
eukprot:5302652-Ditylum_brightwellii.AAC.1